MDLPYAHVFEPDGDRLVPTELARGPWSPTMQHGGAPSALLARAVERHEPDETPFVARLTIDLLRPVPLAPLTVETRTRRKGRKIHVIDASLRAGDTEVAACRALRLRVRDVDLPAEAVTDVLPEGVRAPDDAPPLVLGEGRPEVGFWLAHEFRIARGRPLGPWIAPGPNVVWFRLRVPIVAGEEPSPLMRVAAAADHGNGISAVLMGSWSFVNPDLSIVLHRLPMSDWVGLDGVTHPDPDGVGLAACTLLDERGAIGRSAQTLLLDPVEG